MVAKEIFALDEYNKMFPLEDRNFMQEIADNTMMFSQFLEDSYKILSQVEFQGKNFNSSMDPNGIYPFLKLIKEFQKAQIKSIGKRESYINIQNQVQIVEKAQDQVISKTVQKYKEPFKIDINQHLIKYLIYLQEINEYPFENKAQKEIMDIQNPICQKNMLQQIIHRLNRKRFIQPGQNIQQQQQNLPKQNLNNGLDTGKQLNVQKGKYYLIIYKNYLFNLKTKNQKLKAQRPPCNNADIQDVKMTLNTNNSAQKNSEQRDLITSYKYEIKAGKQKKNQVSQLEESSRNYDFLDDLLGNEDKFLQQNQNQNQNQKQNRNKNQEINNFSADKQVWETKITEENAEFCEDSGQKQQQQQKNRQFMAETKQFSPNQENDQEVQLMNFQNSFSINDNFQDKGEDFQVPKIQERNQANQNFRNINQVQGNQANQHQNQKLNQNKNQNQNQIFQNNQKNQNQNQNQNLVSRQSIGQNNRGSSNSSFNQSLQNDQQAFLEMQMQLDEGVEFQEIDLRKFEKRIQLEYDSYENRQIIHEFEKMKMKYQILPEIKLTVIGGRMKEQNGRNRARNQKKHDFFESEMEQQSNLDIIKIADQDYLPKSPMFDQISRENSKQDFNNLSTNRSMKNINNITGDSFQNNQMISNCNNNNGIIKQQNEALLSRPRSNSKGIFSQQSQNNQGIKNQNLNINGKPPLGNSVQNNSNNLGQLGNQRSRQNQNQIQNMQNQNFMMESFGLQNNNNIFNVNNQNNGESSFNNNYNNLTPTMSLKKQNSQKFNINTNGVAQALDFISSQQRSCQKNTGQKDSSQKKGGRKIFQASLEQSNRFYDQNVKQLMSGQLSQVDSNYNKKRDII
ncbi:hypothetical protein PPERSA_02431 [Pseudocohnilembus persalinus]|uniref:Uncharacterized protein n=1 Tax=Pseudocohnilembus persalinus TaxID=266149 RepID=A0A0V0QB67_PSEPJ|nr:hypothetical protein PPERSA_02431 [Pseudocohnilembus persalinus]|eukprot:KRW99319.1 hypothetical protein PPERSA_02431 [Pseudocohnilembus persalinus]